VEDEQPLARGGQATNRTYLERLPSLDSILQEVKGSIQILSGVFARRKRKNFEHRRAQLKTIYRKLLQNYNVNRMIPVLSTFMVKQEFIYKTSNPRKWLANVRS